MLQINFTYLDWFSLTFSPLKKQFPVKYLEYRICFPLISFWYNITFAPEVFILFVNFVIYLCMCGISPNLSFQPVTLEHHQRQCFSLEDPEKYCQTKQEICFKTFVLFKRNTTHTSLPMMTPWPYENLGSTIVMFLKHSLNVSCSS